MIKESIRYISSKSILIANKIFHKNPSENTKIKKENIENRTYEEILKKNIKSKEYSYKKIIILSLILIIITFITQNILVILELSLIIFFIIFFKKNLPKIRSQKRKQEILKKLPFALRQISTELTAGIGLFDAMKTIANSDYGELSIEFNITLNEIQYGTDYTEAFNNLAKRIDAEIMNKIISQIIRTLNNGGNLANTLNVIAEENSYNMKIKYKEYSEKLNSIMLIYMFIAVLFPVILFVMIIASTTITGANIKPELLLILYLVFFPMIIIFMIIFIKRMEPTL